MKLMITELIRRRFVRRLVRGRGILSRTEYSSQCWCGNAAPPQKAPESDCSRACTGDGEFSVVVGGGDVAYLGTLANMRLTGDQPCGGTWRADVVQHAT